MGLVPVAMGLFGISEILLNIEKTLKVSVFETRLKGLFPDLQDWRRSIGAILRGTMIGFFLGILPGGGAVIASFASYAIEKRFSRQPFSGRSVVVHTVPNPHPRFDAARCLQELVADLAGGRFGGLANRLERFAATYACRAAVKAGQRLEPGELRELVLRLLAATLPAHDVHGRPTIVHLPREELERRFGRA